MAIRVEALESTGGAGQGIQGLATVEAAVRKDPRAYAERVRANEHAQRALDRAREVAEVIVGHPVIVLESTSEGFEVGTGRLDGSLGATSGDIPSSSGDRPNKKAKKPKPQKAGKHPDIGNLTGFYRGVYYRNGQRSAAR